jgi:hypothetical protein
LAQQQEDATEAGVIESRFWTMTPADVRERLVVYRKQDAVAWERAAWMVHHIMSAWVGKNAPSVDKLLGRVESGD